MLPSELVPRHVGSSTNHSAILRADWRFLLPEAVPAKAAYVGGENSLVRRSLDAVCREVVAVDHDKITPSSPQSDFALVVVDGGDPAYIRRATSILAENGSLYLEIDRRRYRDALVSVGRTVGRLAACGLTELETHWHYPSFERRRCVVPLRDASAGIRYLRRSHDKLLLRLLGYGLGLPKAGRLLEGLLPCVSIVARKPSGESGKK